ncbi:pyocin activator PrtN family protein [Acinetobacter wuhouensis]|uniref:Pyocin activator protein PrtN n=1 Tax=Acinetobacter wuhouensis TaxID=1879050 RepID=A0A4Q7AJM4_9GAMM|nr:pyocin activator PrtN family protein [Acinetobacter wuhouensis]RZG46968.1 hypothetical protein EXU28_07185 [Acinetobacter wuhouensis]
MEKPDLKLNTFTILCMRYLSPIVPLDTIVEDYFTHIDIKTARKRANFHELPFPAFRIDNSNKAPYMVRLEDLAIFLDSLYQTHKHDYDAMNNVSNHKKMNSK